MNNIIVGMGEALWDVLPEGKKIGGAPANFAYHVSQFGFDSRVVSAVGNDELGDEIMSVFKEKKLNTQIERVDYPTGTVQVTLDAEGVPCYEIKEGVAWDNIPFTDELKRLALNTRAVCFGSLAQRNEASRATINRFLDTMPEIDGQLKIFDINLRQDFYTKEVLRDSFQRCNVLKINDEELVTISRMFGYPGIDLQDKCWILLAKYNLKMLILTCGINGSYVFTPGVVSFQETPKVPVADTVGAGDSFTAAFCASILNGKPVPEAHKLAVEVCRSKVVVICCLNYPYTVGLTTLVEAFALGLPVICSRNPKFEMDIEEEEAGIYVDYNDIEGWKRAIHYLSTHPEEAQRMGANGRKLAEREFNLEHYSRELSEILADTVKTYRK